MQIDHHLVKENVLSNRSLVTDMDVEDYIARRGRGWVCEIDNRLVGFAIADLKDNNIRDEQQISFNFKSQKTQNAGAEF